MQMNYGGDHTVDVHRIFKNFDADETDPASYTFEPTDKYLATINEAGTKIFYRLGASIEHGYKFGTYPPKDFHKWARICEYIIRHYTEGWGNGFCYDIEYWEIWNEADLRNADGSSPCWQGGREEFYEFYGIAATHLKSCFPHLKIGGPALACCWRSNFNEGFFKYIKKNNIPLDFYSYHCYVKTPEVLLKAVNATEELLKEFGLEGTETILDEWNYVKGWLDDDWKESMRTIRNLKGASFNAGCMCVCQDSPLSMLMYYDARPGANLNGMFRSEALWECLKGYYPFKMFSKLYQLGRAVEIQNENSFLYACAARNDDQAAVMFTYFNTDETAPSKEVRLQMQGFGSEKGVKAEYYLLDETRDLKLVREECFFTDAFTAILDTGLYSSYLVVLTKMD